MESFKLVICYNQIDLMCHNYLLASHEVVMGQPKLQRLLELKVKVRETHDKKYENTTKLPVISDEVREREQ